MYPPGAISPGYLQVDIEGYQECFVADDDSSFRLGMRQDGVNYPRPI